MQSRWRADDAFEWLDVAAPGSTSSMSDKLDWRQAIELSAVVLGIPLASMTVWQVHTQIDLQQHQIDLQAEQDYVARRADLFATLYDRRETCEVGDKDIEGRCPIKADIRAREEALSALVRIERGRKIPALSLRRLDLVNSRLGELDLSGADLREAQLRGSFLQHIVFDGADLSKAKLDGANLFRTYFRHANLSDADLRSAIIYLAFFDDANLHGTDLRDASLIAVDLMRAQYFCTNFKGALNEHSSFPTEFDRNAEGVLPRSEALDISAGLCRQPLRQLTTRSSDLCETSRAVCEGQIESGAARRWYGTPWFSQTECRE